MRLTTLTLRSFRNHTHSQFEFADKSNILLGDNGQGKTNVVEAISYLCLTKSFYAGSDVVVLNFDESMFEIEGVCISDRGSENRLRVAYDKNTGRKAVFINRQPLDTFSAIIGRFPVVICSPDHAPITLGSPGDRRKFVDFVISQSNPGYLTTLMEYRRAVKQRNRVLTEARELQADATMLLEPWNEQLVQLGGYLMMRKKRFIDEFQSYFLHAYNRLVGQDETPAIEYVPNSATPDIDTEEKFRQLLWTGIREKKSAELATGVTMVGPHRDEFACSINGHDLRKYASQGQHKTYLVSLKMAEFYYLKERCNETPMMLLDDVFSELDEHRAAKLIEFVGEVSQTFITSTSLHNFDHPGLMDQSKKFYIHQGRVVEQHELVAP
ncbi:MAG: DNA replication/repair protein RecF [Bacteroidota bacterium]